MRRIAILLTTAMLLAALAAIPAEAKGHHHHHASPGVPFGCVIVYSPIFGFYVNC